MGLKSFRLVVDEGEERRLMGQRSVSPCGTVGMSHALSC